MIFVVSWPGLNAHNKLVVRVPLPFSVRAAKAGTSLCLLEAAVLGPRLRGDERSCVRSVFHPHQI
jgi:hypothetical protein